MRIAVDLSFIRPDHTNGGTETCIRNLMRGWIQQGVIHRFLFFVHEDIFQSYSQEFLECHFLTYSCKASHKVRTTWFQTVILPIWIKKYQVDVLYYPSYTTGYYVRLPIPVIVNPHDIQFKFYPEYFSPLKRAYLDFGYRHSLKRANVIIAISDYVKNTLLEYYGKETGNRIIRIYDPIEFDFEKEVEPVGIKPPFILSVSSIQKHKNMITLIKSFERIYSKISHQLVIVGCKGNGLNEIRQYLSGKKIEERILFTDFVNDNQINWLYNNAELYVTTSLYEGFGMTPIEAMGRGIPTICSKSTSLPEVTMNLANYYEPAGDDAALADKIEEVLQKDGLYTPEPEIFRKYYDKAHIAAELFELFTETTNKV